MGSDMNGPEVLSTSSLSTIISDSLIGNGNYYVDVVFNEPMNTEMKPLIFHENDIALNNSIQYNVNESFIERYQNVLNNI